MQLNNNYSGSTWFLYSYVYSYSVLYIAISLAGQTAFFPFSSTLGRGKKLGPFFPRPNVKRKKKRSGLRDYIAIARQRYMGSTQPLFQYKF